MKKIIALAIILGFIGSAAQADTKVGAPVPIQPVIGDAPVAAEPAKSTEQENKEKEESKPSESSKPVAK